MLVRLPIVLVLALSLSIVPAQVLAEPSADPASPKQDAQTTGAEKAPPSAELTAILRFENRFANDQGRRKLEIEDQLTWEFILFTLSMLGGIAAALMFWGGRSAGESGQR